ncbi:MAG: tetratricopeptide repeat protein [Candidatus Brocadiia bacterium]
MSYRAGKSSEASAARPRRNAWTAPGCAVIVLAALAAYSNSFHGPFIFDDRPFIEAAAARGLWPIGPVLSGQRPVVQASLALNRIIGGPCPTGYHLFNVAVHLLAALTLFGVIRRTLRLPALREQFDEQTGAALAFCAALLWALHPLQTEAVTYIIQRGESLMGLFCLLTLYCFIRAAESPNRAAWHIAAVAACALGMGSKEVMVFAPLIVLLYDRTFVAGSFREALRRHWGLYLGLAATELILARAILEAFEPRAQSAGFSLPGITSLQYAQSEFGVILHYLRLALWPAGLCLDYDWPIAKGAAEIAPGAIVVGILLAATAWSLVRHPATQTAGKPATQTAGKPATQTAGKPATQRAGKPAWGFVGAAFFLLLAPTSSIMPIKDLAFEHRMYLPLAALMTAGVLAAYQVGRALVRRIAETEDARRRLGRRIAVLLVFSAAAAFGALTYLRNGEYASAISIWKDTVDKRPRNVRALNQLADAYSRAGDYDQAVDICDRAIQVNPERAASYNTRGNVRARAGQTAEALADYDRAIEWQPDYAEALDNRAGACVNAGRYEQAIEDCDRAIALKPDLAEAYYNRGNARARMKQLDEAIRDFDRAISLNPDYAFAYFNRGVARYHLKEYGRALEDVRMCEKLGVVPPADFLKSLKQAAGRQE